MREGNFALDGLLGFDIHGQDSWHYRHRKNRDCGRAEILTGFRLPTLAFDPIPERDLSVSRRALRRAERIAGAIGHHHLALPAHARETNTSLTPAIAKMKNGVMLINTSRGALLDTVAIIEALKSGKIGYLGLDVYEEEEEIFFEDRSGLIISDDVFARLLTFPNVIITGHQAFFTREAL